jgi:iron complex transport system substrate-binding protein
MARKDIFNILLCILLSACGNKAGDGQRQGDVGDTIPMKYAEHLTMVRYADRVEVTLKDPWHEGRVMRTYEHRKPLSRCVVFNTAHASLLQMLGAADVIKGVADLKYMNLPEIHRRVGKDITDCGDSMTPDIEKIVEMKADAADNLAFTLKGDAIDFRRGQNAFDYLTAIVLIGVRKPTGKGPDMRVFGDGVQRFGVAFFPRTQ